MHLRGPLALLLCNLAPKVYKPYLQTDKNGQPILYVCTLNALYRTMKAAHLYYQHFVRDIKFKGFQLNPYHPCIANKIVDNTSLTLVWHMDNIKISYMKESVVTEMIE